MSSLLFHSIAPINVSQIIQEYKKLTDGEKSLLNNARVLKLKEVGFVFKTKTGVQSKKPSRKDTTNNDSESQTNQHQTQQENTPQKQKMTQQEQLQQPTTKELHQKIDFIFETIPDISQVTLKEFRIMVEDSFQISLCRQNKRVLKSYLTSLIECSNGV